MPNQSRRSAPAPKLWGSCRLNIMVCVFLGTAQTSLLRDNLGIALVCMSKPMDNLTCDVNPAVVPTLPWLAQKRNCEFDWDSATRGRILGAFLYGYILTSILGGYMANSHGAKLPFLCGGIGNTVLHMLCPVAVLAHTELFFACRVLQGMFTGLMVGPSFQLFSAWASEDETTTLLSFGVSGFALGTIVIYPLSGQLCNVNVNGYGGWPLIFYVPAAASISFILYWFRFLYDVPDSHPKISQTELVYLSENVNRSNEPMVIPWMSIFTSLPFIAYNVCYSAFLWNTFTMMNNMPVFMQTMLGINSKEIGLLFCVPFTLTLFARFFNAETYPMVKRGTGLSHTVCRKTYCVVGTVLVVMSLLSIVLVENVTKWHVIGAITANLALGDFAYTGGFFPTLLNLAPNYAGLLSGISTFVAYLFACPSTLVNSVLTEHNTKKEWNTVLLIIVIMISFSIVIYIIFGSASLQKWSIPRHDDDGRVSISAAIIRQSYDASRKLSLQRPTHII